MMRAENHAEGGAQAAGLAPHEDQATWHRVLQPCDRLHLVQYSASVDMPPTNGGRRAGPPASWARGGQRRS